MMYCPFQKFTRVNYDKIANPSQTLEIQVSIDSTVNLKIWAEIYAKSKTL